MLRFGKTDKKKKNLQSPADFTGEFSASSTTSVLKGKNCSIFGSHQESCSETAPQ